MSEQTTLRDQLTGAFDAALEADPGEAQTVETGEVQQVAETAEQTAQREQRERDERGRFAPRQEQQAAEQGQQVQQAQPKQRPPRPSTWKKEVVEKYWDAIDPELADYLQTREQQYAQGVSTYKQEWERVKPLGEAMQEFMPLLQQHRIDPGQWIRNLGNAHRVLALGSPEEKAAMFQQLAQSYGVQLGQEQQQGDPNVSRFAQELHHLRSQVNHFMTAAQRAEQARVQGEIAKFSEAKPHFEKVRGTMAQLLESGVATDLDTAYEKAVRLHDDVFQEVQAEKARTAEEERRRAQVEAVSRAKANAVSVKGATPSSVVKTTQAKGLRAQLEEAAEAHLAARV
jgi:hypothetical protein